MMGGGDGLGMLFEESMGSWAGWRTVSGGLDVLGGLGWYGGRWDLRSFAMVSVVKRKPTRAVRFGIHRRLHGCIVGHGILDFFDIMASRAVTGLALRAGKFRCCPSPSQAVGAGIFPTSKAGKDQPIACSLYDL